MRRTLVAVTMFLLVGAIGWAGRQQSSSAETQGAVSARDLGLSKTSVTDDQAPAPFVYGSDGPGSSTRLTPAYEGSPPLVPHSLDGLLPITRDQNWCLLCHASGSGSADGPPQVPESHYVDWRNAPDAVQESVAGARWVCTSCHVPQSDARPLVPNTFGGAGQPGS